MKEHLLEGFSSHLVSSFVVLLVLLHPPDIKGMLLMCSVDHASFSLDNLNGLCDIIFFVDGKLDLSVDFKKRGDLSDGRLSHHAVVDLVKVFN